MGFTGAEEMRLEPTDVAVCHNAHSERCEISVIRNLDLLEQETGILWFAGAEVTSLPLLIDHGRAPDGRMHTAQGSSGRFKSSSHTIRTSSTTRKHDPGRLPCGDHSDMADLMGKDPSSRECESRSIRQTTSSVCHTNIGGKLVTSGKNVTDVFYGRNNGSTIDELQALKVSQNPGRHPAKLEAVFQLRAHKLRVGLDSFFWPNSSGV